MNLSFAIERLRKILEEDGDLKIYSDIADEELCEKCEELRPRRYGGFCHTIGVINISNEKHVWLQANSWVIYE